MAFVWDYNVNELKQTELGRVLLLERSLNFGPSKGEKIDPLLVKKYWEKMTLFPPVRRLMELLIWGKTPS